MESFCCHDYFLYAVIVCMYMYNMKLETELEVTTCSLFYFRGLLQDLVNNDVQEEGVVEGYHTGRQWVSKKGPRL